MEQIATYFSDEGVPSTGLSPVVDIWERNGNKRITDGALTEIGGGFYIYNFKEYSSEKQYLYLFDGGELMADGDRYNNGSNDMDAYTNKISRGRSGGGIVNYSKDFKEIKKIISLEKVIEPDIRIDGVISVLSSLTKDIEVLKKSMNVSKIEETLGLLVEQIKINNDDISTGTMLSTEAVIAFLEKEIKPKLKKEDIIIDKTKDGEEISELVVKKFKKELDDEVEEKIVSKLLKESKSYTDSEDETCLINNLLDESERGEEESILFNLINS